MASLAQNLTTPGGARSPVAEHCRGGDVQWRAGLSTLWWLMVERPDEIDRLDDGALAGRLDFDDWIRELADRWTRLGPMGLRADALSLMSGRERGWPPSDSRRSSFGCEQPMTRRESMRSSGSFASPRSSAQAKRGQPQRGARVAGFKGRDRLGRRRRCPCVTLILCRSEQWRSTQGPEFLFCQPPRSSSLRPLGSHTKGTGYGGYDSPDRERFPCARRIAAKLLLTDYTIASEPASTPPGMRRRQRLHGVSEGERYPGRPRTAEERAGERRCADHRHPHPATGLRRQPSSVEAVTRRPRLRPCPRRPDPRQDPRQRIDTAGWAHVPSAHRADQPHPPLSEPHTPGDSTRRAVHSRGPTTLVQNHPAGRSWRTRASVRGKQCVPAGLLWRD